ncbi:hypothetical protein [Paraglaciecola sp.]|uniref:hypothetical protein n=1 Tax=Paraglaciecola sp. TaxID=1920173 RepID=UPI003F4AE078
MATPLMRCAYLIRYAYFIRYAHRNLDNCVLRYSIFRHPWRSHADFHPASLQGDTLLFNSQKKCARKADLQTNFYSIKLLASMSDRQ